MSNLILINTFSILDWKNPFWEGLDQKTQNRLFNVKFRTQTNSNKRKLKVMFTLSFLDQKYSFMAI